MILPGEELKAALHDGQISEKDFVMAMHFEEYHPSQIWQIIADLRAEDTGLPNE